jgi:chromodomain-helicase-DNA-binding protein 7
MYQIHIAKEREPLLYTPHNQPIYVDGRRLRGYQLESLNWMVDAYYSNRNLLLADEMGLGKTV